MTILITLFLAILILVEAAQVYYNWLVYTQNIKVYQKSIDNLEERIRKADHIIKILDQRVVSKVAANAFVISADGIKVLPEDWRERLAEK